MGETTTRMKVIELVMDWKLWPRHEANKLDSTNLSKLRDVLRAGREFSTPIIAERKSLRIVDGFHRVHVLLDEVGDDAEADVTLKDYENEVAARIDAARHANSGSLQLTPKDRVHFALGMRRDRVPWPIIADALDMEVERCRKLVVRRSVETEDGKIAVSAGAEALAEHLLATGKKADAEQEHFARSQSGSLPMMNARMLLNALRAYGSIEYDVKSIAVLKELAEAIREIVKKVEG